MSLIQQIKDQVKPLGKRIVLPEYKDARVLRATAMILKEGFCKPVLVGNESEIRAAAHSEGVDIKGAEVIDPANYARFDEAVAVFTERRAKKGMTPEKAAETLKKDCLFFGAMLVNIGEVDAMVAGSASPTANVLRAALQCVGTAPGMKTVSSSIFMFTDKKEYGDDGVLVFSDCGVIPNPSSEQLADIACAAVEKSRRVLGMKDPRVSFLSFSTKGSASSPEVDKVVAAVEEVKKRNVDFKFDGELQLDASIVESVGAFKAPQSEVAGKANILIFPDLQAANIGYKLVQRFAGATAIGPLIQGLAAPIHDLSRGCFDTDIADVCAIAAVEASEAK
ncbi:MAG: phosphate acetyltransferase [Veillonella sp.]|uniref:phosphate acetyltransferase n=1 Tax=Veillonella sp. TaxID=1926307 RepID=UPI001B69B699|nr:phosphate acetyltransferase [Veillonella sp.]MBP6923822.1 phosphate acetyltransferase [Veillonella sp.]